MLENHVSTEDRWCCSNCEYQVSCETKYNGVRQRFLLNLPKNLCSCKKCILSSHQVKKDASSHLKLISYDLGTQIA